MNDNTTHNSTNRILALGIALTIGVGLVILFSGQQPEENPTTATPPPQPEAKEEAKASDGLDAAAAFRERHNRALSPEAREDHRRKLWEQNFPFQPTFDPAVTVTAEMISDEPEDLTVTDNHFALKHFLESELRFSPQFEQLYRIMEECDRTENPLALASAFQTLREYQRILREENLDEIVMNADGTPSMRRKRGDLITLSNGRQAWKRTDEWETFTWGEHAESFKDGLWSAVDGRWQWPHKEPMHEDKIAEVVEKLVNEVSDMADLGGRFDNSIMAPVRDVDDPLPRKTLKVGDPLLTPYVGYQAGFDAWNDERNRAINEGMAKKRRKNRPAGILADGTLVNANNEPIKASAGSFGSFVNFGEKFDLQEMEDGSVRLSPEAMASLDEGLRNKTPPQNANPPAQTEEEWKMLETIINAIEFKQE